MILSSRPAKALRRWLRGIILPGFKGISLYDSLNFFRREIFSPRFNDRASAVSFKFIMALPPFLLLLFTLVPYMPIKNFDKELNEIVTLITPNIKTQKQISTLLTDFYKHKKNTLLSFSILLTLYYSSNGMMGLIRNFMKALPGFKRRTLINRRGIAIMLTFLLLLSIFITVAFLLFKSWAFKTLGLKLLQKNFLVNLFSYIIIIGMIFFSISMIYRYGPAIEKRWGLITPGSIVATVLIIVSTMTLFYIADSLINYGKIYGSIGSLILFILWIFYNAQILLIGFELNVSIMVNRKILEQMQQEKNV